jgi:hypothetical protein
MRDTFYFSHDYNARTDSKIKRLISRHGMAGYGIYWAIVEDLYQNANALPTDYESIAFDVRSDAATVKSIVNDFELFAIDGNIFGSMSVQRRLDEREQRSEKARDSARQRWNKDANALRTHIEGNAIKGKERKGKESKGDTKKSVPPPPTIDEVIAYFKEKGYTEASARKAYDYYQASVTETKRHWSDGKGQPVRNWKMKMQSVWFKDENKYIEQSGSLMRRSVTLPDGSIRTYADITL